MDIQIPEIAGLQLGFTVKTEQTNQCRIGVENPAVRRGKKDPLPKRFKQLSEPDFGFVLSGDVASPAGDAHNLVFFGKSLQPAIEIALFAFILEAHQNGAGPKAIADKFLERALYFFKHGRLDEFAQAMPDEAGKGNLQDFSEPPVGDAHFTFQGQGENRLIEVVDQLAIVVLRARNDFHQLLELVFGRVGGAGRRELVFR